MCVYNSKNGKLDSLLLAYMYTYEVYLIFCENSRVFAGIQRHQGAFAPVRLVWNVITSSQQYAYQQLGKNRKIFTDSLIVAN
jgi:hypothetical protein